MDGISLMIKPASGACENDCAYCFYQNEMRCREVGNRGIMTLQTLESLVKKAFAASRMVSFIFQGGEPMLAGRDFYEAFVRMARTYGAGKPYTCSIQTAGGRIDADWADFLKKEGFLVGLSVDGDEASHDLYRKDKSGLGTYAAAMRAAELLRQKEVPFNVLCVVTKANAACPEATYDALRQFGYIQFIPCLEAFKSAERIFSPDPETYARFLIAAFDRYEADFRQGRYVSVRTFDNYLRLLSGARPEACSMCGRCTVGLTVESDGSVYPCDFYCLDEYRLGSIEEMSLNELMKCEKAAAFVNESVYMHPECRRCRFYSLCRGGCRREREPFDEMGRPGLNRYCASYRSFFEARYANLQSLSQLISN